MFLNILLLPLFVVGPGGGVTQPAAAEHRYTREKMLELCGPNEGPPDTLLKDPAALCGDPASVRPLAYTSLTQEEQVIFMASICLKFFLFVTPFNPAIAEGLERIQFDVGTS